MKIFTGEIPSNPYTEHDWQKEVTRIALVAKAEGFKEGQQSILSQIREVDLNEAFRLYHSDTIRKALTFEQYILEVKP